MTYDSKKQAGRDGANFSENHLDIVAFAEAGATLAGTSPLSHYPRLASESLGQPDASSDAVRWQATGRTAAVAGDQNETWMHLQAQAQVAVQCQRCLEPMQATVEVDRSFRFVKDEATAERLDDEIEEDVLVYRKDFDLRELVEDELLMAFPVSPRHGQCPAAPRMQVQTADFDVADAAKPNPFAALQALKKKP